MRIGPNLCPSLAISPRKRSKGSSTSRSRLSCVMAFGILTAKRKWSGTSSAKRS
jgi:hypothetical protein